MSTKRIDATTFARQQADDDAQARQLADDARAQSVDRYRQLMRLAATDGLSPTDAAELSDAVAALSLSPQSVADDAEALSRWLRAKDGRATRGELSAAASAAQREHESFDAETERLAKAVHTDRAPESARLKAALQVALDTSSEAAEAAWQLPAIEREHGELIGLTARQQYIAQTTTATHLRVGGLASETPDDEPESQP